MTENSLKSIADTITEIANDAAMSVALRSGMAVPTAWIMGGKDENQVGVFEATELEVIAENVKTLAGFVRENPLAPVESLWIFGAGRGFHPFPSTGFLEQPFHVRHCYRVFRDTIVSYDQALVEEEARAPSSPVEASAPPVAAALLVDPRDTILELQPDPLELARGMILAPREPVEFEVDPKNLFPAGETPTTTVDETPAAEPAPETFVDPGEDPDKPAKRKA